MVLKNSNCEINSGNTLRPRYFRMCCWPRKSRHSWICKIFLNKLDGNIYSDVENADILEKCSDYVDDGDIQTQNTFLPLLRFSLNKHKRWLIPDNIEYGIHRGPVIEENFKITCAEYVNPGLDLERFPKRMLCVCYLDSEHLVSVYSHRGSHITDLKKSASPANPVLAKPRRRIYHNMHKRGLQRKVKKCEQQGTTKSVKKHLKTCDCSADIKSSPAEEGGLPEIHYEVITPADFNSSLANCIMKIRNGKKSSCKIKGQMSKGRTLTGLGTIRRDIVDELQHFYLTARKLRKKVHSVKIEIINQKTRQEKKQKFNNKKKLTISLDDIIVDKKQTSSRRSRHRKRKLKGNYTEEDGFVIVHKDTQKSVIPVLPVNPASSALTKKYGKGHLVFEKPQKDVPSKDAAFAADNQQMQHGDSENCTLFEDVIRQYNSIACVLQILMEQISPRHLVKICGTTVDVGLVHPYTFVLDLDEDWSLSCRMSPGLSLWPDPRGQTLVTIRVSLQSTCKELSSVRANKVLSAKLQEKPRNIYTLKELLHLTDRVCQEISSVQQRIPKFNPKSSEKTRNKIYEHLFSKSILLKTARDIRTEQLLTKNRLPSYVRLNFLALLEADLCVVEECSVCCRSWDGSKWSWLSHNMTLLPCRHSFCHSCWQTYLCHKITEGQTTFLCMEYGCETEIDTATVASLVPGPLLARWQHQCDETYTSESHGWHLCPNLSCKYLARFDRSCETPGGRYHDCGIPIHCHCGEEWCLGCKKAPHWPALCHHSEAYHNMLILSDDDSGRPQSKARIHHRNCERCSRCKLPVKMNGAVSCRCIDTSSWRHLDDSSALSSASILKIEAEMATPTQSFNLYKQHVRHRLAWKQLSSIAIAKQSAHIVRSQRKQSRGPIIPSVIHQIQATEKFIRRTFQFVRDMHIMLENCGVLISNTGPSTQLEDFMGCCSQIDFLNTRIENTLTSAEGKKDKMLTRLKSLSHLAWAYVDRLVKIAPDLHARAAESDH